jgi:hypothetical protein
VNGVQKSVAVFVKERVIPSICQENRTNGILGTDFPEPRQFITATQNVAYALKHEVQSGGQGEKKTMTQRKRTTIKQRASDDTAAEPREDRESWNLGRYTAGT